MKMKNEGISNFLEGTTEFYSKVGKLKKNQAESCIIKLNPKWVRINTSKWPTYKFM